MVVSELRRQQQQQEQQGGHHAGGLLIPAGGSSLYIWPAVRGDLGTLGCLRRLGVPWGEDALVTLAGLHGAHVVVLGWLREQVAPLGSREQVKTAAKVARGRGWELQTPWADLCRAAVAVGGRDMGALASWLLAEVDSVDQGQGSGQEQGQGEVTGRGQLEGGGEQQKGLCLAVSKVVEKGGTGCSGRWEVAAVCVAAVAGAACTGVPLASEYAGASRQLVWALGERYLLCRGFTCYMVRVKRCSTEYGCNACRLAGIQRVIDFGAEVVLGSRRGSHAYDP